MSKVFQGNVAKQDEELKVVNDKNKSLLAQIDELTAQLKVKEVESKKAASGMGSSKWAAEDSKEGESNAAEGPQGGADISEGVRSPSSVSLAGSAAKASRFRENSADM
jgi:hypothetical protein